MRILPQLLVTVFATTTLTTEIAAACGDYVQVDPAPRVLAISTHYVLDGERSTNRAFVVLERSIEPQRDKQWDLLAPGTFDTTRFLVLPRLASPMEVTLVGPSGTRLVQTDKQVALAGGWQIGFDQTRVALEVPVQANEQFAVAIAGRATDARWHVVDYHEQPTAQTKWWLQKHGIEGVEYVVLRTIRDMPFDLVEYSQGGTTRFIVRDRGRTSGLAANGSVLGAVTTKGRSFIVFTLNSQIGLLELPKATKI